MVRLRSGHTYIDISLVFDQIERFYIVLEELSEHYNIRYESGLLPVEWDEYAIMWLCRLKLKNNNVYNNYLLINYKICNFLTYWNRSSNQSNIHIQGSAIDTLITEFIVDIKQLITFPLYITCKPKVCIICYDIIDKKNNKSICRSFIKNNVIEHNYHTRCLQEYIKYKPESVYYSHKKNVVCLYCNQQNFSLHL